LSRASACAANARPTARRVQRLGDSGRGVDVLQVPRAPATRLTPHAMPRATRLKPHAMPRATRHAPRAMPRATHHAPSHARRATPRGAPPAARAARHVCDASWTCRRRRSTHCCGKSTSTPCLSVSTPPSQTHAHNVRARVHTHTHTHTHARENATRAVVRSSRHDRHQMTGTVGYYGVLESTQGRRAARLRRRRRRPLILRQRPRRPPPLRHAGTAAHGSMYAAPLCSGPVGSQAPRVLTRCAAGAFVLRAVGPSLPSGLGRGPPAQEHA
jgi:hypothetical protein